MSAIAILTYHSLDSSGSVISVAPRAFVDQMACLADLGWRGISLREAVAYRDVHGVWPSQSVVLTFDDGYANVHTVALPALVRHHYTATVFVVSGYMGRHNGWGATPAGLGSQPILSWRQAADLAAAGIEIASHTRTHPDLQQCSAAEVERQIVGSCADIEAHLGLPVQSFAYPFGHVSSVALQLVQRRCRAACTTVLKRAGNESLSTLPRVDMYYIQSPDDLQRVATGQWDGYLTLRRWGRWVRHMLMSISRPHQTNATMSS